MRALGVRRRQTESKCLGNNPIKITLPVSIDLQLIKTGVDSWTCLMGVQILQVIFHLQPINVEWVIFHLQPINVEWVPVSWSADQSTAASKRPRPTTPLRLRLAGVVREEAAHQTPPSRKMYMMYTEKHSAHTQTHTHTGSTGVQIPNFGFLSQEILDLQPTSLEWISASSPADESSAACQWPRPTTPPRLRFAFVVHEQAAPQIPSQAALQVETCHTGARWPPDIGINTLHAVDATAEEAADASEFHHRLVGWHLRADMYHDPNAGMPPPEPAAGYAYGVAPAATRRGHFDQILSPLAAGQEYEVSEVGQPAQYIYKASNPLSYRGSDAKLSTAHSQELLGEMNYPQISTNQEKKVKELFHQYSGADRKLQPHEVRSAGAEVHGLAFSLGAQLGVDPAAFGDIQVLFHRYDFSGDGELDESEDGLQRHQQQSQAMPMQRLGGVKFHERIPFKQLDQAFVLQKKLGQGGQGAVYLATDRSSKLKRVVKFYNKSCANAPVEDIVEEFNLLTSLDHPKIARLYEVFQDHVYIYVVSEPYFGGDLTTCAQKATERGVALNQSWLAGILKQICVTRPQERNVVVIDFGLARDFRKGSSGVMGTPGYMPPEVWTKGVWTCKGDIFSMDLGDPVFMRLALLKSQGRRAFEGQTVQQLQAGRFQFEGAGEFGCLMMLVDWQPLENCLSFQDRPMVNQDASSPVSKEAIADLGQFKPMPPSWRYSLAAPLKAGVAVGVSGIVGYQARDKPAGPASTPCYGPAPTTGVAGVKTSRFLHFLRDPSLICLRLVRSSELGRLASNVVDAMLSIVCLKREDIMQVDTYQNECPILERLLSKGISPQRTRDRAVHLSLATVLTLELLKGCPADLSASTHQAMHGFPLLAALVKEARQITERTNEELLPQFMVLHENPILWFSVGRIGDENAQLDADHSGVVTEPEARKDSKSGLFVLVLMGVDESGFVQAQIDLLVKTLLGSSGTLTYSRFMAEMISAKKAGRKILFGPHMLGIISFLKGVGCLVAQRAENDEVLWLGLKASEPPTSKAKRRNCAAEQWLIAKSTDVRWRIFKELDADNSNSLDANEIKVTFWDFKRALEMMDMTRSRTASSGARTPLYAEGDKVQYFSATYTQWMDTMITAVDLKGLGF
ncbi:Calcium-dependent protein kinase 1 [Symbiodinium microadriaticum]|uniref:non-specific serine/threonine protein kinase n=1 Tax=Symbiodinium microadriaticum TaxID=2951 RepID=A0A1Q9EHA7_SYMMI|nr:Calcium-dependent protein kinase 1 [Symbiodinium microadriaticum]